MKQYVVAMLIAVLMAMLFVSAAFAESPHFLSASAALDSTSGVLVATFKEAGLGSTASTESITLSAHSTAVYACINGGGKHPKASNKETVSGPVSAHGAFPVRNGQTTGNVSLSPVGPGEFSCSSGQALVLVSVSYADVALTGLAGDTASIAGAFSACLFEGLC